MNSNVQIKVLQIRLKNGAYIDAENGSAYDCSGQMIDHLTPKSLEVLHCIAKHSISPAKGILAAGNHRDFEYRLVKKQQQKRGQKQCRPRGF